MTENLIASAIFSAFLIARAELVAISKATDIHTAWVKYATEQDSYLANTTTVALGRALGQLGYTRIHRRDGKYYAGLMV